MSSRRLLSRVPSATIIGTAVLTHHELRFHKISNKDGTAKCDIFETGKQSQIVMGVVFDIPESEKPLLDKAEGVGNGYETKDVAVELHDSFIIEAYTYYATHIDPSLRPFHWYKQHVLAGALEHGLPEDYIRTIHAIESIDDPDDKRHQNELAIYL
jgi:hypothetical protein